MATRRTAQNASSDQIPNLEDGEELEIVDKRTIRRQTVKTDTANATDATGNTSNRRKIEPDADDGEDNDVYFEDDSLFSLIVNKQNQSQSFENELCNIIIKREPDLFGEKFINPCSSRGGLPMMKNIPLSKSQEEIGEEIRQQYGGGHYYCQIQYKGRYMTGFNVDLLDTPEEIRRHKEAHSSQPTGNAPTDQTAATSSNPMQAWLDNWKLEQEFKKAFLGADYEKYEEWKRTGTNGQTPTDTDNKELNLLKFAQEIKSEELMKKVIASITGETGGGVYDGINFVLEHQDKMLDFGGKVAGLFGFGHQQAEPETALNNILKKKNPADTETQNPTKSDFKRTRKREDKK